MDNARKKYANIEGLSIGDIFALLDLFESDDEGDIDNIMNNSNTEFVAESESVTSTNIIRKEEIGDQSSSVLVPEASIQILSTRNENKTDTLGQYERNLLLKLNILPISHRLLPINILLVSCLLLLLLDILPISHPSYSSSSSKSTQEHQETEAKFDDQSQNEKEKGHCSIRQEQHKPVKVLEVEVLCDLDHDFINTV